MIEARELTKRYGPIQAVAGVSFSIGQGEVVGLLGPNGAGKTSTMRMLTTFLAPSSGTATIAGYDIVRDAAKVRSVIGNLPELPPLYPELRVAEYLRFVGELKGLRTKEVQQAVSEVMASCGLLDVASRLCSQLSRGYRQRVGIAQALVHRPKVIILDEPTSGLDPKQIIEIRNLISGLRERYTVLLSTHILSEVSETCSRVIIIAHGRVVVEGELRELTREKSLEQRFLEAVSEQGHGA